MRWGTMAVVGVLLVGGALLMRQSGAQQDVSALLAQAICLDQEKYKLGEPVAICYTVQNKSTEPVVLRFPTSQQFDIWVKRGELEHYRFSRGKAYLQAFTSMVLQPGEVRRFGATWDQTDSKGKQVGPGIYDVYAQLTTSGTRPPRVSAKLQVGTSAAAVAPVTIREAVRDIDVLADRMVEITATYRGWQPDHSDANIKDGPPVSRSDWAICDKTGCMYVNGRIDLNPERDVGKEVVVSGKLKKTPKGQVYVILQRARVVKK